MNLISDVDKKLVDILENCVSVSEALPALKELILEARIDEVGKALSYTTMEELKNRYYYLCNSAGLTPVKRKFVSREELKNLQSKKGEVIDRRPHNAKVLSDHWEDL